MTLTKYGTWTSDSANVPQDAPDITSETSIETNEDSDIRKTIIWTDGTDSAYQVSAFYTPTRTEYRQRRRWEGKNFTNSGRTTISSYGTWSTSPSPPQNAPNYTYYTGSYPPGLPSGLPGAGFAIHHEQYERELESTGTNRDGNEERYHQRVRIFSTPGDGVREWAATFSGKWIHGDPNSNAPNIASRGTTDTVSRTITGSPVYTPNDGPNENTWTIDSDELRNIIDDLP